MEQVKIHICGRFVLSVVQLAIDITSYYLSLYWYPQQFTNFSTCPFSQVPEGICGEMEKWCLLAIYHLRRFLPDLLYFSYATLYGKMCVGIVSSNKNKACMHLQCSIQIFWRKCFNIHKDLPFENDNTCSLIIFLFGITYL